MRRHPNRAIVLALLLLCLGFVPNVRALSLNEIRIDSLLGLTGQQYIELLGDPGESLNDVSLVVLGPGGFLGLNQGLIKDIIPLTGQTIALDNPFFLIGDDTFNLSPANLLNNLDLPIGASSTILLVRNLTGTIGQDLDTNNDGILDLTPWGEVVDSLGILEPLVGGLLGNKVYSPTQVSAGLLGINVHLFSDPNGGSGVWIGETQIINFDLDTPGIANLNSAPTSIELSNTHLSEDAAGGTLIGTLTTIDPDEEQSHAYSFVAPYLNGGGLFQLVGNQLKLAPSASLDFETSPSLKVSICSRDNGNGQLAVAKDFTISVDNVADVPRLQVKLGEQLLGVGSQVNLGSGILNLLTPSRDLTLTNIGDYSLNINGITLPDGFTALSQLPLGSLAPGQSVTLKLGLLNSLLGNFGGQLVINTNDLFNGLFSLEVSGSILEPNRTSARNWSHYE